MARKSGKSLSSTTEAIHRRYVRGSLVRKVVKGEKGFSEAESEWRKETACLLAAAGFSESYIADALGTTRATVNGWFKNDPRMKPRVTEIKDEMTTSALKLLRSYMLEAVEMLMEIARSTEDDALAAKVLQDFLDRGGLSKVSKTESISAQNIRNTSEIDITDKSGLADSLRDSPPEVQVAIAERMDEILALASEHTEKDLTHG